MKKEWIRRILMILLACIFFTCGGIVFAAKYKYIVNNRLNRKAVQTYTVQRNVSQGTSGAPSAPASSAKTGGSGAAAGTQTEEAGIEAEAQEKNKEVPIEVDFEALRELNPEIIGWIYCEDTEINFPIAQTYDKAESMNAEMAKSRNYQ